MRISDWSSDVCSSDLEAVGEVDAVDRGIGIETVVVADRHFAPLVTEPQHHVDDAAGRRSPVDRRGRGRQHLDAFDSRKRDAIVIWLTGTESSTHDGMTATV